MPYFQTDNKTLTEPTNQEINDLYNNGFLFTRVEKGNLYQTRSLRVNLSQFELSSENRRILGKNEDLSLNNLNIPLENYDWKVHSYGKDFYFKRFGDGTMSASKIKEMFIEPDKSNMNSVLVYNYPQKTEHEDSWDLSIGKITNVTGLCLIYSNEEIVHYAYPFYDLSVAKDRSLGLAMMTKALVWAQENNKKYMYLGSVTDSHAHYKLQFKGLEWFDSETTTWSDDLSRLKLMTTVEASTH